MSTTANTQQTRSQQQARTPRALATRSSQQKKQKHQQKASALCAGPLKKKAKKYIENKEL